MKIPLVDLVAQYKTIQHEIDEEISSVLHEAAFIQGDRVRKFERTYSDVYGTANTISCANGTDAIYIALKVLGIGPGDEVITTAHSWISTSEVISQTGAKPVFVDVEPNHFTIDTSRIEAKINDRTRAIIPVHLYGHPANMGDILSIAKKHELQVIEDCAQAHFAKYNGQNVGTFGQFGTFSFFPGKNLGAYGDAGGLITDDNELAVRARMFANHGALTKHAHKIEGINSRLDGLQAGILNVKLNYIQEWTKQRILIAKRYDEQLAGISELTLPTVASNAEHVFHLYVVRTERRDELLKFLNEHGVGASIHYPRALPLLEAYSYMGHTKDDFPVSGQNQEQIMSLPIYPELSLEQQQFVTSCIRDFFSK